MLPHHNDLDITVNATATWYLMNLVTFDTYVNIGNFYYTVNYISHSSPIPVGSQ